MRSHHRFALPAAVAALALAGCAATYHRAEYVSTLGAAGSKPVPAGEIETRIAGNFEAEIHALYAKGYELIGYAQFTSPLQPQFAPMNARWAAEHHGATYVLLAAPSQRALNQYFYITTFWRPGKPERFIFGAYYDDGPAELLGVVGCERNLVMVRAVAPGTPAERMGLKSGDVITLVDDQPVDDARALDELLLAKAGREVEVRYLREEKGWVARGRLAARAQPGRPPALDRGFAAGLVLRQGELSKELAAALGRKQGMYVGGVAYGSPACSAGLRAGDLIASLGGEAVAEAQDVKAALEKSAGRKLAVSALDGRARHELTLDRTPAALAALEPLRRLDIAEAGYDHPWTRIEGGDYTWAAIVSLAAQSLGEGYRSYLQQQEQERVAQVQAYNQMQAYRRSAPAPLPLPEGYRPPGRRQAAETSGAPPGYQYSRRQQGLVPIHYPTYRDIKTQGEWKFSWPPSNLMQQYFGQLGYLNYDMARIANSYARGYDFKEERRREAYGQKMQ
jgi:membrane-associated protease RseP (regulator of RpoE activity)